MKKLTDEQYREFEPQIYRKRRILSEVLKELWELQIGEKLLVETNDVEYKKHLTYKEKSVRILGWKAQVQNKTGRFFKLEKLVTEIL
jgi:hypothetical protein